MLELFRGLLDTSDFPPRWYCGTWSSELGWLHIVSDIGVWSAYVAIPCVLGYYLVRKRTLPFRMIFALFGVFILACGTTHLMEAIIFWWPAYRLAGLFKLITAIVSWATVIALIPVTPRALAMRTPEELGREILDRKRAEQELERYAERLRQTNQQLLEAERLKSELLANVSHELRTPLTLILAPVESLLAGENGPVSESQMNSLRTVHNNAVRLLQMVTSLLDVARNDAGKFEVHREPVELVGLVESIMADFRATVDRRGLRASSSASARPVWARMDRYLFERILFNLLSNAIKFTPAGGSISVALDRDGDRVELSVSDTGIGIAASDLPHLFERFRQVEGSSTRRFEGTGLGLALVKSFAELLGGSASVSSTPEQGSTFAIECLAPACDPDATDANTGRSHRQLVQQYETNSVGSLASALVDSSEKPTVLVAEDNADLAYHIATLLEQGYNVKIAADGHEALERCRSSRPDLVLADVMMPGIDGYALCRAIKSDPAIAATPVVLLTAITQRDAMIKGWEAGADEYLQKPFHSRELVTRISTMIASARDRKRMETLREQINAELELRVRERTAELQATQERLEAEMAEQARMEESLKRADRLKDEYVAMLAHELRNPLAPIRNALVVMRLAGQSPAILAEARDMADRQVQHMARLLDDLLDVARISHGKIAISPRVVDLIPIVQHSVQAVRTEFDDRSHRLSLTVPDDPVRVMGDPTRLEQILNNLLNNAAKYTNSPGEISVSLEREGGDAVLRVRDNGIGISPDMLGPIFDLFVQANDRSERPHSGVGIGLTLIRKLVELHGGTVTAFSEGIGKGSEFVLRLQSLDNDSSTPTVSAEERDHMTDSQPRYRVLIVDDNVDAGVSLGMLLRLMGQEVEVVHGGAEAIIRAGQFKPQLILLDIGMPGMDGYEVCRRIRQEQSLDDTTIVALTGWGEEEVRRLSHAAGFDRHLVKPVEPSSLNQLINELEKPHVNRPRPGGDAGARITP